MSSRSKESGSSPADAGFEVPRADWRKFLSTFARRHQGWIVQLETYDRVTEERVLSEETPLETVELDLEDRKNPRINVIVHLDNKVLKHILFSPSRLSFRSADGAAESLRVETINTNTTIRLRPPAARRSA